MHTAALSQNRRCIGPHLQQPFVPESEPVPTFREAR